MNILEQKNSKKQGDVGLGIAIAYFTSKGYTVSIPLTDSQDYDLIIDDGTINRVQIKTTRYKRSSNYSVSLTVKGGNRTFNTIKMFDKTRVDSIFIVTADFEYYWIPVLSIEPTSYITLNQDYNKYKVIM